MRHHAMAISGWQDGELAKAHDKAVDLGLHVTSIGEQRVNGIASFFVEPDGSKEGWETSQEHDDAREELVRYLKKTQLDWVLVQYGDDEGMTVIIDDSDRGYRRSEHGI